MNITGAITLSAWIKPEATGGIRNILAHGHATSPAGEVLLRINNGSDQVGNWNGTNHFTSAAIPAGDAGQWVHLTDVFDPRRRVAAVPQRPVDRLDRRCQGIGPFERSEPFRV